MTVQKILLHYDPVPQNILQALKEINKKFGYIGKEESQETADYFDVSLSRVFEVASFFDLLSTKPKPALLIKICSSGPCAVHGSPSLIREIEQYLKVKADDESNPAIKLETTSCMGLCDEGPIVEVNGTVYTKVKEENIDDILSSYV